MENTLEVYHRPYNRRFPLVCLDETNRQLIAEMRKTVPAKPGYNKHVDYEYRRNGVVNLFMMFEPLRARRNVKVMDQRTRKDFAECIRELVDVHYAEAEKIVLVNRIDNDFLCALGALCGKKNLRSPHEICKTVIHTANKAWESDI